MLFGFSTEPGKAAVMEAIFIVGLSSKAITKVIGIFDPCNRKTPYTQSIYRDPYLTE